MVWGTSYRQRDLVWVDRTLKGGGVKSTLVWVRNTAHPTGRRVWVDRWKGRVERICEEMKGIEYSPGVHQGWLNSGPA